MGATKIAWRKPSERELVLLAASVDGIVLDMDGVVTATAKVHSRAWKRLFDEFLGGRRERSGEVHAPFDIEGDYRRHVDGKPRYDGVASFLVSRGIQLPWGDPADPPERSTICGLGNRKNSYFLAEIREQGVRAIPETLRFVRHARNRRKPVAVISASRNAREVLRAAGIEDLFDALVDGVVADEIGLRGKPNPDIFLEAARRLGVCPGRAVVVEDAESGAEAGRRGGFGLVIGMGDAGRRERLKALGADVVLPTLDGVTLA